MQGIRWNKWFVIIALVLGAGYFVLSKVNHRDGLADFRVYYDAASAILHDTTLYGKAFGVSSGFYKYSPFAALPFVPFALLPFKWAAGIYYFLVLGGIIFFLHLLYRGLKNHLSGNANDTTSLPWLLLVTLFLADHFERELHLGNVNLFLLFLGWFIYQSISDKKQGLAGLLFGILLLFKPHFLLLMPLLVWRKQWVAAAFSLLAFGVGLLVPVVWKGWSGNADWLAQWMHTIGEHNVHLYESPNTVYGITTRFILEPLGISSGNWIIALWLVIIGGGYLWWFLWKKSTQEWFGPFFVLVALIPNLVHTDTEHFMWSLPLIGYFFYQALLGSGVKKWMWGAMILAFIPYTVNSPDLVGRNFEQLVDEGGLLGVANLIVIVVFAALWREQQLCRKEQHLA